eukprot:COSAG01_NODE_2552_length_7463_cov_644.066947_6_plen_173_part_00
MSFTWKNCAYTRSSLYPAASARSSTWLGLAAPHLIPTAPGAGKSAKPTLDLAIATFQIQMCWIPVRIPSPLGPLLPVHLTFDLVWMCCARCADYLNGVDLVQCGENGYRRVSELGPKVRQCIATQVFLSLLTPILSSLTRSQLASKPSFTRRMQTSYLCGVLSLGVRWTAEH